MTDIDNSLLKLCVKKASFNLFAQRFLLIKVKLGYRKLIISN